MEGLGGNIRLPDTKDIGQHSNGDGLNAAIGHALPWVTQNFMMSMHGSRFESPLRFKQK